MHVVNRVCGEMYLRCLLDFPALIFGAVWILLFTAGRGRLFQDPGSFSHTVIGERILATGQLICRDSYSFTRFGDPWIAQQWLGECIMAGIQRTAGLDGLLVVSASLIALLYSNLAARIERSGMNLVLGSLILFLSFAAGSHHFHVRPHLVTILFMTVLFSRLTDVEAGRTGTGSLFWLVPMFVIWSNIHGGALGGLFTFLIAAAGWTIAWKIGRTPMRDRRHTAILWILVLLCFVTPLVNPYGLELPATWLDIMRSRAISELIREHASVLTLLKHGDAASFMPITILISLGVLYLAILAGTDRKDRKVTWFIPVVWLLLSLSRIRHAPLFAILSVIAIADMFPYCRWVHRLGDRGLVVFRTRNPVAGSRMSAMAGYVVAAVVTGAALIAFHGSAQLPSDAQKWVKLDGEHWPIDVLPELRALDKSLPQGSPIFNDMLFGGFLMYHTPGLRVFIDDRCELYGDDFLIKYVKAERSDFETWTKAYHFNLALLEPDSNYRKYFEEDPDWHVVKRCPTAVLYQKRGTGSVNSDG
jgi:hypothetical protein